VESGGLDQHAVLTNEPVFVDEDILRDVVFFLDLTICMFVR
jgi:hypothetical protein